MLGASHSRNGTYLISLYEYLFIVANIKILGIMLIPKSNDKRLQGEVFFFFFFYKLLLAAFYHLTHEYILFAEFFSERNYFAGCFGYAIHFSVLAADSLWYLRLFAPQCSQPVRGLGCQVALFQRARTRGRLLRSYSHDGGEDSCLNIFFSIFVLVYE